MAASSGIYTADDLFNVSIGSPSSDYITREFTVTLSTALAQTGAAKFLLGDIILLAPLPPRCKFDSYRIYCPNMDTGSGASLDVGDSQILSGAVTAITSGSVAIPSTVGTTFTLTATASTSSFTSTNALLSVNGLLVNYESLSGSTFVNCRTSVSGGSIPNGAAINQCANTAAYQAASLSGCANAAGVMTPDFAISAANAIVTSTPVLNGTPAIIPGAFQTSALQVNGVGPLFGNVQPFYFLMRFHAAISTIGTTSNKITGWVSYRMLGM